MKLLLWVTLVSASINAAIAEGTFQFKFIGDQWGCYDSKGQKGLNPHRLGECGDLKDMDLRGLKWKGDPIDGSDLENANLEGAEFGGIIRGVRFRGANLRNANLDGVSSTLLPSNWSFATFEGATLHQARLRDIDMQCVKAANVYLKSSNLTSINFNYADLRNLVLAKSKLNRVSFESANLSGATFAESDLMNVSFRIADLRGADLSQMSHWTNIDFQGASYNDKTRLPFTKEKADSIGMIYINHD